MILFHDFETRSELDIDVGTENYAAHSSTKALLLSWAPGAPAIGA
jgi:hypothetical protein